MNTHFLRSAAISTGLLLSVSLFAQEAPLPGTRLSIPNSFRNWSVGINAGPMVPVVLFGGRNDYTRWKTDIGYGGYIKYQLLSSLGVRADFLRGNLEANNTRDLGTGGPPLGRTNSAFRTEINWAMSLNGEFTFANWRIKNSKIQPYLLGGAGLAAYSPRVTPTATGVEQDYNTGDNIHELIVPLGGGVKFGLNPSMNLNIGYTANLIDGDNLDGYFFGPQNDKFSYTHIGLEFVLGDKSKPQLAGYNPVEDMRYDYMTQISDLKSSVGNQIESELASRMAAERAAQTAELARVRESLERLQADADGDGVSDHFDKCPGTPAGTKVDGSGCPLPVTPVPAPTIIITEEDRRIVAEAIRNLEFDFNKATIRPSSFPSLNRVAELLVTKNFSLKLAGHTDNVGSNEYNLKLSKDRAESVKAYLVSKSANPSRIEATGYGESQPIETNNTAAGRQKNRRVEFTLY